MISINKATLALSTSSSSLQQNANDNGYQDEYTQTKKHHPQKFHSPVLLCVFFFLLSVIVRYLIALMA